MFAKLSALALCLSLVSALTITVPDPVRAGTSVELSLTETAGKDPNEFGLLLVKNDYSVIQNLLPGGNLTVDFNPEITVNIPIPINAGEFWIIANKAGDQHTILATSNLFTLESYV
ncbi:hypothetical protein JVT61DRAFT_11344 [Boletus reticuloceps]|uniref:Uncharacterized protein n=1 Tax=Boletus reticuloceps TaxID=495285 RepID=A0A8I3A3N4_9AGAM|nr:hypothetical protein JVT61DRAFT_11344 [Boletus reticuloceps]